MADLNRAGTGRQRLWLLWTALAFLFLVTACQRTEAEITATFPPPPQPESATGYPEPVITTIETGTGYPPPATPVSPPATGYPDQPSPEPAGTPSPTRTSSSTPASTAALEVQAYIPVVGAGAEPTATPSPTATHTPSPTPTPTIDFAAVRASLQAQGQDLGFVKIGLHVGVGGNRTGLGEWMRRLDEAGIPFFLKSADDSGPILEAQEIVRNSDVPHVLVYRRSGNGYDTPDYNLPPVEAARRHWQLHKEAFPAELDPSLVWLETINEVDKTRSEWLGQFALETARLAMADGFRWAAFGWSSGEPEAADWQAPSMLAFLRLAAANPDRLAIAVHEYSYTVDDIADQYPFKVGRFQQLYEITDRYGIPRPTVLITEWGWEYQRIPSIGEALDDIHWAAAMYAPYPELRGAAIWYLGNGFGDIAAEVQRLIMPLTEYTLGNYFEIPLPPEQAEINPEMFRP